MGILSISQYGKKDEDLKFQKAKEITCTVLKQCCGSGSAWIRRTAVNFFPICGVSKLWIRIRREINQFKNWPRPLYRARTDLVCPQKPNPSRETVPLKHFFLRKRTLGWAAKAARTACAFSLRSMGPSMLWTSRYRSSSRHLYTQKNIKRLKNDVTRQRNTDQNLTKTYCRLI